MSEDLTVISSAYLAHKLCDALDAWRNARIADHQPAGTRIRDIEAILDARDAERAALQAYAACVKTECWLNVKLLAFDEWQAWQVRHAADGATA